MKAILRHVDRITRHRDRALLDISIAQALTELVPGGTISIHALRAIDGVPHAVLALRSSSRDFQCWSEDEQGPETRIDRDPLFARCLERATATSLRLPDGSVRTAFALTEDQVPTGVLEIDLAKPLSRGQQQLVQGFVALHRNFLELLRYSQVDALTGLLNRKTFDENLRRYLASDDRQNATESAPARRRRPAGGRQYWLGVIDIDHFKRINDRFGHLYGDEVLILVAKLMKECFRQSDKLFRFGGEEFVVVLPASDENDAGSAFERFRAVVETHDFPQVGRITISTGFTRIRASDPPAAIVGRADDALYHAKGNGRNQVHFYESLVAQGLVTPKAMNTEAELF